MRSGVAALAAVVLMAGAAPAAAQDEGVSWSDVCGDADTVLRFGETQVGAGDSSTSPTDIRATTVTATDRGFEVRIEVCGPVDADDTTNRLWRLEAAVSDRCRLLVVSNSVLYLDGSVRRQRDVRLDVACLDEGETVYESVADATLPPDALTLAGTTVTMRVDRIDTWEVADWIEPGDELLDLRSSASENLLLTSPVVTMGTELEARVPDSDVSSNGDSLILR